MAASELTRNGFPSPFEIAIPPACEGWDEMYPHYVLYGEDRRAADESRFWFQDALHYPEPYHPFDAAAVEFGVVALNQASARLFVVPPSLGIELRIFNGYVYFSANSVTDEAALAKRSELFGRRGGYYYEHWDELDTQWRQKVEAEIRELEALGVPDLPEVEDERVVTAGRGFGSSHTLLVAYDRLLGSLDRVWQYHFELLNLGYGAYLVFYEYCRQVFPDIPDQTVARMVAAIDVLVLRPDDELRRLARLAVDLGLAAVVKAARTEQNLRASLSGSEAGERWLADLAAAKDPWFNLSCGNGLYHHHRAWSDDTSLPIGMIGSYVAQLEAGEDIARPYSTVLAERDRITDGYRALLSHEQRRAFDDRLALARTVYPHIEDHNFYVDHWYHSIFWNKVREFGALLAKHRFLVDQEDVFYLRHDEVRSALSELRLFWSSGSSAAARGPEHWPPIVDRRKTIYAAMRAWAPPPALGEAPVTVTEPVTVMHWGITTERVEEWLAVTAGSRIHELRGVAGSPGKAEGLARVILHPAQLGELHHGEILIAASTATSWTPVFGKIAAAVLDTGGIMCHAAIIAREYGLPAVLGTGSATKRIQTGDRIRVDADAGIVTILVHAGSTDVERTTS